MAGKLGLSALINLFTDLRRKPITDRMFRTLIISLWREYKDIPDIVNVEINNSSSVINQSITQVISNHVGSAHESYLIENTTAVTETVESSWSVLPYAEQVGEFKAVVMIRNKATDTIVTLISLLSFDYSEVPSVVQQNNLLTGSITLTVGVNGSNRLYAQLTGMPGDDKRIHFCFERCVLSQRPYPIAASGNFALSGNAALMGTNLTDLQPAIAALSLQASARLEGMKELSASGNLSLNGIANFSEINPVTEGLKLTFDDIANVPVANPASVSEWNTFFDLPANGTAFTSVVISGNEVTLAGGGNLSIKSSLFLGNVNLLQVIDTNNMVTGIGNYCFLSCSNLATVELPAVESIGEYAFAYCAISSGIFDLVTSLGAGCFSSCQNLTDASFALITTLPEFTFDTCTALQFSGINLPQITRINQYAFQACTSLETVEFNDVTYIEQGAFHNSSNIQSVSFPSATYVGEGCFSNNSALTVIELPVCSNLGGSVLINYVFSAIIGNVITITIPATLMTCNGGNPDGDIFELQSANTVTVITT